MVGENWLKVAIYAMALGVGLYVIPLGMIANPALLGLASDLPAALLAAAKIAVGLFALSSGVIGTRSLVSRLIMIIFGLLVVLLPIDTKWPGG